MNETSTQGLIPTSVQIDLGSVRLEGDLAVPENARGVVLFVHGSGSGRRSTRNRRVAECLQAGGLATLLFDLLTEAEEFEERHTGHLRFDIDLLIGRLVAATEWVEARAETRGLKVAYFGASTGGAAALGAAAERPEVAAVVSRGGRPDLTPDASLACVQAPTLLIVGGADAPVLSMNRRTMARMKGPVALEVVPGASHLFEEPGALEQVAKLARAWFELHL
ncbi:dienelactone hydrolase family protein [Paludisphaera mucosa]|uniref:Dienelactone hydrolase family protein n=1 Tax=Paludisphaera mucosa TaxID=3030827 RepID=A0ABT6FAB1_9BACT|nr:alpha/beta family hydrolase [Paludisphaera mucosa]MDG3004333.1 dienelactone hydrolase family protein [Paludisphaera mucosa]